MHDPSLPGQHTSQTQTSQTLVMERATQTILFLVLFTHFGAAQNAAKTGGDEFSVAVGVILDLGTLVGKNSPDQHSNGPGRFLCSSQKLQHKANTSHQGFP